MSRPEKAKSCLNCGKDQSEWVAGARSYCCFACRVKATRRLRQRASCHDLSSCPSCGRERSDWPLSRSSRSIYCSPECQSYGIKKMRGFKIPKAERPACDRTLPTRRRCRSCNRPMSRTDRMSRGNNTYVRCRECRGALPGISVEEFLSRHPFDITTVPAHVSDPIAPGSSNFWRNIG